MTAAFNHSKEILDFDQNWLTWRPIRFTVALTRSCRNQSLQTVRARSFAGSLQRGRLSVIRGSGGLTTDVNRTEKGVAGMPVRRLILISGLVLAVVAMSPAAAMGAAKGTDRPLKGTSTGTNTVNLVTGAATNESSGHLSHLGAVTGTGVQTITLTGPNTFSFTGAGTTVAANGNKLFATTSGTGTLTSTGSAMATTVNTITGGTGRFAGASGTFTVTSVSTLVSIVGSIETFAFTSTTTGQISY
jgi:autotransporter adhesin